MIRMDHLKYDGFHINPLFDGVLDRSYACAFLGVNVPCPTPEDGFTPEFVRQRMDVHWPRLGYQRGARAP